MTDLEKTALAYFLAGPANDLVIAGRWYPRSEIGLIVEDKFQVALRKFGPKAKAAAKPASAEFVGHMIDQGGWSTKPNDFGGTMHQFQPDVFRATLKAMQAGDPIVQGSAAGGESYWADKFSALTAA
jgi:hypothetical protein